MAKSSSSTIRVFRVDAPHELQTFLQKSVRCQMLDSVDVLVCDDTIELRGSVQSWYEKQLAQESIRGNSASRRIRNSLCIAGQSAPNQGL